MNIAVLGKTFRSDHENTQQRRSTVVHHRDYLTRNDTTLSGVIRKRLRAFLSPVLKVGDFTDIEKSSSLLLFRPTDAYKRSTSSSSASTRDLPRIVDCQK